MRAAEEARRLAEEKAAEWENQRKKIRATITSPLQLMPVRQKTKTIAKSKAVVVAPAPPRQRVRPKGNKHSEAKTDREEARAQVRGGKGGKHRKPSTLQQGFNKPAQAVNRDVIIGETITVAELANKMAVKGSLVIKAMMKMGAMATINRLSTRNRPAGG